MPARQGVGIRVDSGVRAPEGVHRFIRGALGTVRGCSTSSTNTKTPGFARTAELEIMQGAVSFFTQTFLFM
jgi:hypothetical protein